jgi:type IV pilus assembly protein PilW
MVVLPEHKRVSGLTLLELLIASLLGVFLLTGIVQIFMMANQVRTYNNGVSVMQENARFAFNYLTREIRLAGYLGCNTVQIANTLNSPSAWQFDFSRPVFGFDGDGNFSDPVFATITATTLPSVTPPSFPAGDFFTIYKADSDGES